MKILRVIASVDPKQGGPIVGLQQSTAILLRSGHETEVVTLDDPGSKWISDYPFKIHALGRRCSVYSYSPRLVQWLNCNASRFDVVVQHGLWNYTAYATWRALRGEQIPYFVFTHGMLDPWFRRAYPIKNLVKQLAWWISEGRLLRDARLVLFTTEEEKLLARNAFWPYRLKERVVSYGTAAVANDREAQVAAFHAHLPAIEGRRFLLFLSRIHPKKGCDMLIDAFATLAARDQTLDLVIAGPDQVGWTARLKARAASLGVAERIHWPGMLIGYAKWGAFRSCEAFVLPSHQENFGIVVAEAMACGKLVLITDKVNIWREVEQDACGLVAPDTTEGVRSMLSRFADLPEQTRIDMGHSSEECFFRRFDIEQVALDLIEIFESSCNQ